MVIFHLFFILQKTIEPKYIFLFFYCFFTGQPFKQNIWSSSIYSFFSGRPFDQKFGYSLIYFFYLHTAIRPKCMVLFHLFFRLCATIQPNIMALIDLFLLFAHDHLIWMCTPLPYILSLCTTIRPKIRVLINLFVLFIHDHWTKIRGHSYSLIYSFLNCANISYAISWQYCPWIHVSTVLIFCSLYSWPYEASAPNWPHDLIFTFSTPSLVSDFSNAWK